MGVLNKLSNASEAHERVSAAVLLAIEEHSTLNPHFLGLNYKLSEDLGLNRMQVQLILFHSAKALGLNIAFESCRVGDSTANQLIQQLSVWTHGLRQNAA